MSQDLDRSVSDFIKKHGRNRLSIMEFVRAEIFLDTFSDTFAKDAQIQEDDICEFCGHIAECHMGEFDLYYDHDIEADRYELKTSCTQCEEGGDECMVFECLRSIQIKNKTMREAYESLVDEGNRQPMKHEVYERAGNQSYGRLFQMFKEQGMDEMTEIAGQEYYKKRFDASKPFLPTKFGPPELPE
jgi:hypothetical protein